MTTVSVLIPTFNPGRLIDAALASVLGQRTSAELDVVVVDDGSTDGTADHLRATYPHIRVIEQHNAGTAAARNRALAEAAGDFVALLDQDDTWDEDKIERQLRAFTSDQVGMVHSGGRFRNARGDVTSIEFAVDPLDVHDLVAWCWVIQSTAVIRTSLLRSLGGFDVRLSAADDWDLWIRLAAVSQLAAVRDPLVNVLVHEGNQSNDPERMYEAAAGVIRKHAGLHPRCTQCRNATRAAELRNRQEYYRRMRGLAKQSRAGGRPFAATRQTLQGLRRHPRAPIETVRHHVRTRARSTDGETG